MSATRSTASICRTPTATSTASPGLVRPPPRRAPVVWHPEPRRTRVLGRHAVRRPHGGAHGLGDVLERARRGLARGARRRAARDPQVDARDRPASSYRAAQDLLEALQRARGRPYEDWIRDVARGVLDQALVHEASSTSSRDQPRAADPVPVLDLHRAAGGCAAVDLWGDQMIANQDPDLSPAVVDRATPRRTGSCRSAPRPRSRCSRTPTGSASSATPTRPTT